MASPRRHDAGHHRAACGRRAPVRGWRIPITSVSSVFYPLLDLACFAANIVKIPQGGSSPLLVGMLAFALMSTRRRGRQIVLERTS